MPARSPGQQRRRVHQRKRALRLERVRDRLTGPHPRRYVLQLSGEIGVLLALRQHLQRAQNRHAGADQRQELLVEDQEGLKLRLARGTGQPPRFHRVDEVPGLRESRAQLFRSRRRLDLLLHMAALVGQPDHEFCHGFWLSAFSAICLFGSSAFGPSATPLPTPGYARAGLGTPPSSVAVPAFRTPVAQGFVD